MNDDVIYYFGGRTAISTLALVNTTNAYSISGNTLTTATEINIPTTRTGASFAVYKPDDGVSRIIMLGGFTTLIGTNGNYVLNGTSNSAAASQGPYYLNYPFTGPPATWQIFNNLFPQSVAFGSAVIKGSTLYHFGGTTGHGSGVQTVVYSFNVEAIPSGSWISMASMPTGRIGHTAVLVE